jgi:hypothetical protein
VNGLLGLDVSPNFRRAAHLALDILLDAAAEELRGETKKKRRAVNVPAFELPKDVKPEELEVAERQWSRNGFVKKGHS